MRIHKQQLGSKSGCVASLLQRRRGLTLFLSSQQRQALGPFNCSCMLKLKLIADRRIRFRARRWLLCLEYVSPEWQGVPLVLDMNVVGRAFTSYNAKCLYLFEEAVIEDCL